MVANALSTAIVARPLKYRPLQEVVRKARPIRRRGRIASGIAARPWTQFAAMLAIFAVLLRLGLGVGHALALSELPADSRGQAFAIATSICSATGPAAKPSGSSEDERPGPTSPACPVCLMAAGHLPAVLPVQSAPGVERTATAAFTAPAPVTCPAGPAVVRLQPRAPPASL